MLTKASERTQVLRAQLAANEAEEKKLTITLEVLKSLEDDDVESVDGREVGSQSPVMVVATPAGGPVQRAFVPTAAPVKAARGIRGLIVGCFVAGEPQTAHEVVKRLEREGHTPNASTVSSTLSKLVTDGVLVKASQSAYLLKVESPNT